MLLALGASACAGEAPQGELTLDDQLGSQGLELLYFEAAQIHFRVVSSEAEESFIDYEISSTDETVLRIDASLDFNTALSASATAVGPGTADIVIIDMMGVERLRETIEVSTPERVELTTHDGEPLVEDEVEVAVDELIGYFVSFRDDRDRPLAGELRDFHDDDDDLTYLISNEVFLLTAHRAGTYEVPLRIDDVAYRTLTVNAVDED